MTHLYYGLILCLGDKIIKILVQCLLALYTLIANKAGSLLASEPDSYTYLCTYLLIFGERFCFTFTPDLEAGRGRGRFSRKRTENLGPNLHYGLHLVVKVVFVCLFVFLILCGLHTSAS